MLRRRPRWGTPIGAAALVAAGALAAWWLADDVDIRTMAHNSTVASRDGTAIAFSRLGHGPPLVLVDGAFCFRQNGPTPTLAPLLAHRFTVYAYDRRGRGDSANTLPYAIEREVEDLGAMLHRAGGSAFVFGMSSGAGIALRAAESGLGVKKLALYEPPYVMKGGEPRSLDKQRSDLDHLVSAGDRTGAVMYFMTHVFGAPKFFIQALRPFMRNAWNNNESVAHTLPYDLTILSDWSIVKEATSIDVPVLVIGGAKSSTELQEAVNTVASAVPRAQRRMLEGQSHNVSMQVLAPVLAEFFLGT